MIETPPIFADLTWTAEFDTFVAEATAAWWIYYRPHKQQLRDLGLRVTDRGNWVVIFEPWKAPDSINETLEMLELEYASQVEAAREQERRRDEWRAEQERLAIEREKKLLEEAEVHRQSARECIEKWGLFAVKKARLIALIEKPQLAPYEVKEMRDLVEATEAKALDFKRRARSKHGDPVDWPEAEVERAIRFLTTYDADQASLRNDRGWSAADSSWGHWCNAQLDTDERPTAIRVARVLVGAYASQLDGALS